MRWWKKKKKPLSWIEKSTIEVRELGFQLLRELLMPYLVNMVNPGAFQRSWREFLLGELPSYGVAVIEGYAADVVALIQRHYFKRYPVELPHMSEPSPEFLENMEDDSPDAEVPEPDQDKMSDKEYKAAMDRLAERQKLISYRKAVSCALFRSKVSVLTSTLANQTLAGLPTHEESGPRPKRFRGPKSLPYFITQTHRCLFSTSMTQVCCQCLAQNHAN